jgi:predicted enzyme related to lactoylglutathione lyase
VEDKVSLKIKLTSVLVDDQDKALGIPLTAFAVDDIQQEYSRLKRLGVVFRGEPAKAGATTVAVFEDTCGNLIQLYQE